MCFTNVYHVWLCFLCYILYNKAHDNRIKALWQISCFVWFVICVIDVMMWLIGG